VSRDGKTTVIEGPPGPAGPPGKKVHHSELFFTYIQVYVYLVIITFFVSMLYLLFYVYDVCSLGMI